MPRCPRWPRQTKPGLGSGSVNVMAMMIVGVMGRLRAVIVTRFTQVVSITSAAVQTLDTHKHLIT